MATINKEQGPRAGSPTEEDYATLARAGGRKDLLQHREFVRTNDYPLPYPRVEWFDHRTPDPQTPPDTTAYQAMLEQSPLRWPLPVEEDPPPRQRLKLPRLHRTHVAQLSRHTARSKSTKLPAVPNEPVNFMRLLSMDYQQQWLEETRLKEEDERRKAKEKRLAAKRKLEEHTMRARKVAGVGQSSVARPRFIMKSILSKWLLLSWLLHKQKREFSDTNFEIGKALQGFPISKFANIPSKLNLPNT